MQGEDGESCSLRVILVCAMVRASGRVLRRKHLWRSNVFVNANVFPLVPSMAALIMKNTGREDDCWNCRNSLKLSPISSVMDRMRDIKYAIAPGTCPGRWVILKANCENVTARPGKYPDRRFGTISGRMLIARDLFS